MKPAFQLKLHPTCLFAHYQVLNMVRVERE